MYPTRESMSTNGGTLIETIIKTDMTEGFLFYDHVVLRISATKNVL